MEALVKLLGEAVSKVLVEAIRRGRSRREALEEAINSLDRDDVVSDELWEALGEYAKGVKSFEDGGA